LVFSWQGFTKFLNLVCLLNRINNVSAMLLLFPVILLLSKKWVSNNSSKFHYFGYICYALRH